MAKVYSYFQTHVIAATKSAAHRVLEDEFGRGIRTKDVNRAKPPFSVCSGDEILHEGLSEAEYIGIVETYAGGIVCSN